MTDATLRGGLRRTLARWVKPHPFVIEAELPEQRSEMLLQNWTHPGKVEAPYTVCIASASNLTGLVKSSVECRRTGL